MATAKVDINHHAESTVLPPPEARELFDRKARALLGISGSEFLRRWDAGQYRRLPETPENRNIMRVAALMPFGRR